MRTSTGLHAVCLAILSLGWCCAAEDGLVGHWPFDSSLTDVSGAGNHAIGPDPDFAQGKHGVALTLDWRSVEIPSAPELQLAAGLAIDCWVYFDKKPQGYQHVIIKDDEYQLRIDHEQEGGRFAFFVCLAGWEPRVRGPVPEAGRWYHLIARWTGSEISLEVNGEKSSTPRVGVPVPAENPIRVGAISGRIDELKLSNPNAIVRRRIDELTGTVPDSERSRQASFGQDAGWDGWRADWGATMTTDAGLLKATLDNPTAMLFHPALDLDLTGRRYVSLDIQSDTAQFANLVFMTDKGHGVICFPLWNLQRTTIVHLGPSPQWTGRLRFLGIAFPDAHPHEVALENLYISDQPQGKPLVYARSLTPGRAILRAGRPERIIAVVRSIGAEAAEIQARLVTPPGAQILDDATRTIPVMAYDATEKLEWTVRADHALSGPARLILSATGFGPTEAGVDLEFTAPLDLPKARYVPEPRPARTHYTMLMHYCPLWKFGTHYGWGKIEPWPERKPAIGWYDEGAPEVADWHIKYALEHGIQAFIYCWYRSNWGPDVKHSLGHAIHDGLLKAKYLDMFRFCIMWENGCAKGVQSRDDMMDNLLPYWMENYFKHPSYVKVDNKPVLFVWRPERVMPQLGGNEATKQVFDEMRAECKRQGFDGLYIIGCVTDANEPLLRDMAASGWDASSAYATWGQTSVPPGRDMEGCATIPHKAFMEGQRQVWLGKKKLNALPDIVSVMMGWDPRPWHGKRTTSYKAGATPANFKAACVHAKQIIDATPGNGLDKRLVVFDNWDEFGEGHYLEPCAGYGFGFLDAIRSVFCDESEPCVHITPEDVGLETPDRLYRKYREIMIGDVSDKKRKVTDNLVAWWAFEGDDANIALDSSNCAFHGFKRGFEATEGIEGKGFLCTGGSVSVGPSKLMWPPTGITIELWFKTDTPDQQDRWMVNTIGRADTGYRLGLTGGKLAWQIPVTAWSHMLTSPDPARLGEWTHIAATYDNQTMRLFVNGQERAALERGGEICASDARLCLGSYAPSHPAAFFEGIIDEVKIYDRALTAEEVRAHFAEARR